MGGKNKQSQRTKNNVRPSSSGRSAELLNNAGKFDTTMTTVGGKLMPALFPSLAAVTLDSGLDPELAICIKKLNKKDPITKTKALHELTELVNKSSVQDIEAVLPGWSHFYKILSVDPDCKVRESTQVCHGAIVRVCGRRVAPQLRRLLPAWLQAQRDDHQPAQAHAQRSLQNTFPEAKLPEVIAFCETEILEFFEDNLIGAAAAAEAGAEAAAGGGRVRAAALRGLAWLLRRAPAALLPPLAQRLATLQAHDAFWKLAAHPDCAIRAAWFTAMGGAVERLGAAAAGPRLPRALLAPAPAPPPAQWRCLLLCLTSAPDWQTWVDKKDLVTKRILNLLENGGWGDARALAAALPALLQRLPPALLTDRFYTDFFDAMFKGLEKKSIMNSKSERQAWLSGLAECIRAEAARGGGGGAAGAALRRWAAAAAAPALLRPSAAAMADLIKFWMQKAKEEDGDHYTMLVRNFWQNISAIASAPPEEAAGEAASPAAVASEAAAAARHVDFLVALRHSFFAEPKKQHSIRFEGDEAPEPEPVAAVGAAADAAAAAWFSWQHGAAAARLCARHVQRARAARAPAALLPALAPLLSAMPRDTLEALARQLDAPSAYRLFQKLLLPWLHHDDTRCEPVMDFVFQILPHMTEDEQDATYDAFTQEEVVEWALWRALSHEHGGRAARRWLRGAGAAAALRAAAAAAASPAAATRHRDLLLLALTPPAHHEPVVDEETVCEVVEVLVAGLAPGAEHVAAALAALATALAPRPPRCYPRLLLALLNLTLAVPRGSPQLSPAAWLEARAAWQAGLLALPAAARAQLQARALAALLDAALPPQMEELNIQGIEHATSLCPYLLSECGAAEAGALLQQLFAGARSRGAAEVTGFALRHDCVAARLAVPAPGDCAAAADLIANCDREDLPELTKPHLVGWVSELLLRALSLRSVLLPRPEAEPPLGHPAPRDHFCQLLHDYAVLDSLHDGYAFWAHYDIIEQAKSKMDAAVENMIAATPRELRRAVAAALRARGAARGFYWAAAAARYHAQALRPLDQSPDHTPDQTREQTPDQKCDQSPDQTPDQTREQTPDQKCDQSPDQTPDQTRDQTPDQKCDQSPDQTPDKTRDQSSDHDQLPSWLDMASLDVENIEDIITGNGLYHTMQTNQRWLGAGSGAGDSEDFETEREPSAALVTAHLCALRAALLSLRAAGAPPALQRRFARDAAAAARRAAAAPDLLVELYYQFEHVVVGERAPASVPWAVAACSAAVADYLALLVAERGWRAAPHHWDFATIELCALLAAPAPRTPTTKSAMLTAAALRLLRSVRAFVAALPARCQRAQPAPHVAALMQEWRDIFSPDIHTNLFNTILAHLEASGEQEMTCPLARTLSALTEAARSLQWAALPAALRAGPLALERLAERAARALARPQHRAHKYLAHALLTQLAEDLVLDDAEKLSSWSEEAGGVPRLAPARAAPHCRALLELLDAALAHIRVGEESCEMALGSDARGVALGALLLADALHAAAAAARGDLPHHYIQIFREEKLTEPLLAGAVRLLPGAAAAFAAGGAALPARLADLFHTPAHFSVDEPEWGRGEDGVGDVARLACRGVWHALAGPGQAAARAAWAAWPARAARGLARLVAAAVAPPLLRKQFRRAAARAHTLPDTELTLLPAAREATAVLTLEDQPLRLTITFSAEHPLRPPAVAAPAAGPAAGAQWLAVFLGFQNGDLLQASALWARAVGARVERAPQCYICYCRLHPAEGVLPKVFCNQCKNKFHNACLRKWFTTSRKSNCPVCRAMF